MRRNDSGFVEFEKDPGSVPVRDVTYRASRIAHATLVGFSLGTYSANVFLLTFD